MENREGFNPEEAIKESLKPATGVAKYGISYLAKEVGGAPASSKPGKIFHKICEVLGWVERKK